MTVSWPDETIRLRSVTGPIASGSNRRGKAAGEGSGTIPSASDGNGRPADSGGISMRQGWHSAPGIGTPVPRDARPAGPSRGDR